MAKNLVNDLDRYVEEDQSIEKIKSKPKNDEKKKHVKTNKRKRKKLDLYEKFNEDEDSW